MTKRILEILDNVRYWETCPDDYKKDIETFLEEQNKLNQDNVTEQINIIKCSCVIPTPQMKVSENVIIGYCSKCLKEF